MNRLVALFAVGFLLVCQVARAEVRPVTYTYKQVGELPIKADVYRGEGAGKRPVVVWIHGGALINGHRESAPKWLLDGCLASGSPP